VAFLTWLLSRSAIERALDVPGALAVLEDGFRRTAGPPPVGSSEAGGVPPLQPLRVRTDLPGPGTATCLMPGLLPGVPAYTVKVNAKFPAARPALRGVVCLHDLETGKLLALADSAAITAWRTGLAAALATHALARPDARVLGVVGAGAQARMVVAGLRHLRSFDRVVAADLDRVRAGELTLAVLPDAPAVARAADVLVLATWSRQPLLHASDLRPGQHLTSLGADEPGKIELSADLLTASRVIVDDRDLAAAGGALGNAGLPGSAAAATLGEVLRGDQAARAGEQPTVYAPVGLPWQDLALTWLLYQTTPAADRIPDFDLLG
jgi:ornithine cyclodeaminase/alanine dehydrogenase-like protein (mu-crystallin family)